MAVYSGTGLGTNRVAGLIRGSGAAHDTHFPCESLNQLKYVDPRGNIGYVI
jgi:hypothetical protein